MKFLTTAAILAIPCVLADQNIPPPEQNTCANDNFGQAVATNGNWLAVGAPGDDATCFGGYVHLYVTAGVGDDWTFVDSVGFDDGREFGWSIDMVDTAMYVSRPQALTDCGAGVSVGNVAVFEDIEGSWNLTQVIFPSNACTASTTQSVFEYIGSDMHFGYDVASYGNHMIVGTRMCNADYDATEPVFNIPGYAYIFSNATGVWTETDILVPDDASLSCFGSSVAMTAEWAAVGAPYSDPDGNGGVYIFTYSSAAGKWVQEIFLKAPRDTYQFGAGLDLSNQILAISGFDTSRAGYVYLYEYIINDGDGEWGKIEELDLPKESSNPVGQVKYMSGTVLVGVLDQTIYFEKKDSDWSEPYAIDNDVTSTSTSVRPSAVDMFGDMLVSGYPMQDQRRVYVTSTDEINTKFSENDDDGAESLAIIVGIVACLVLVVGFTVLAYCVWNKRKDSQKNPSLSNGALNESLM